MGKILQKNPKKWIVIFSNRIPSLIGPAKATEIQNEHTREVVEFDEIVERGAGRYLQVPFVRQQPGNLGIVIRESYFG